MQTCVWVLHWGKEKNKISFHIPDSWPALPPWLLTLGCLQSWGMPGLEKRGNMWENSSGLAVKSTCSSVMIDANVNLGLHIFSLNFSYLWTMKFNGTLAAGVGYGFLSQCVLKKCIIPLYYEFKKSKLKLLYFLHWKISLEVFCVSQNEIYTARKVISCCTYQN